MGKIDNRKPTPQAFGSLGGKSDLAPRIVKVIPEHTTYAEPFAGGAAVYFYKEPAEKEILNDRDKEIAFAYRFIRDMTEDDWARLQRKDWVISQKRFDAVKQMNPASDADRFYKFYYLKKGSFRTKGEVVNTGRIGLTIGIDRLPRVKKRLRGVATSSVDAVKMIDRHDSKNTFFYLDPPYPGISSLGSGSPKFTKGDLRVLLERLKHIKGKFLLSIDKDNEDELPANLEVKRVKVRGRGSMGHRVNRVELLVANYPIGNEEARRRLLGKHAENFLATGHI